MNGEPSSWLRLRFLGGCEIQGLTGAVSLEDANAPALLAFLALHPDAQPFDQLTKLLWSQSTENHARQSLRRVLRELRQKLALAGCEPIVDTASEQVHLPPERYWLDSALFESLLAGLDFRHPSAQQLPALQAAAELYRGNFLEGVSVKQTPVFAAWVAAQREHFCGLACRVFRQLVELHAARGDYPNAELYLRRLIEIQTNSHNTGLEENHRLLIHLLFLSGQRNEALSQYDTCRQMLKRETNSEPCSANTALFELICASAPKKAPAARLEYEPVLSLPSISSAFLGRELEIARLKSLVSDPHNRLITINGPAGCGKSRLAQETIRRLVEEHSPAFASRFPDGVRILQLSGLTTATILASSLNAALGSSSSSETNASNPAAGAKDLLVIGDNFENSPAAVQAVAQILKAYPRITLVVTSRKLTGMPGERPLALAPLPLPRQQSPMDSPACGLFVDRARAARSDFSLTAGDMNCIAQICTLLGGLPLSIELAAARCSSLTPRKILAQLQQLGQPDLNAVLEWIYQSLNPADKEWFTRLSIFEGRCTFHTGQSVCGEEGKPALYLLDSLVSLERKRLLQRDETSLNRRSYQLHPAVRDFGRVKLIELGEYPQLSQRLAAYFLGLSQEAELDLKGQHADLWLDRLDSELSNLHAALADSLQQDPQLAAQACSVLWRYWLARGMVSEGRYWVESSLSAVQSLEVSPQICARLNQGAGTLAYTQNDHAASIPFLNEALKQYTLIRDREEMAQVYKSLGNAYQKAGDHARAEASYRSCLDLYSYLGDRWSYTQALNQLCLFLQNQGDLYQAHSLCQESLQIQQNMGNLAGSAQVLTTMGSISLRLGKIDQAVTCYRQSVELFTCLKQKIGILTATSGLAQALLSARKLEEAAGLFAESLQLSRELNNPEQTSICLDGLARLEAIHARPARTGRTARPLGTRLAPPASGRQSVKEGLRLRNQVNS